MSLILGIDPGVRGLGVGVSHRGKIVKGGYVTAPGIENLEGAARCDALWRALYRWHSADVAFSMDELVIECPQVYGAKDQKGDQNDLIELTFTVGYLAGMFRFRSNYVLAEENVTIVRPRAWKGTLEKSVMCDRIEARLTPEERAVVDLTKSKKKRLDVLDGVGLVLHHLGRLDPVRVFG